MIVSGEEALLYDAVRLDSCMPANRGPLVRADDQSGEVEYRDTPETTVKLALGQHAIRIIRRGR